MFQEMGFGVAVALLLDATLIRMVILPSALNPPRPPQLVPAPMAQWLPHLGIEAPDALGRHRILTTDRQSVYIVPAPGSPDRTSTGGTMTIIELEAHRHTITTPQGPVSCIDVGSGPVALFVHGLGTNALLWHHVIQACADDRRRVAIDLPLHGRHPGAEVTTSA